MFYGLNQQQGQVFKSALDIISALYGRVFRADHLITIDRCMGFIEDEAFNTALGKTARTEQEQSLIWRLHTLGWAAKQCLSLPGDFVECGVYKGFCSHFLVEYTSFDSSGKTFFLYDTFSGIPESQRAGSPVDDGSYQEEGLYEATRDRFSPYTNVKVIRGVVPDILTEGAPERIAFLHLDMNAATPEIGALEVLFDRIVPGGMIVLDDYGWQTYRAQKDAEDPWFAKRGYQVLEIPTGQGLVVKRPA